VSGVISEGTGRKRLTADQWITGRRTPRPEVLAQIARNLRRRAVLLQALAAEFDQHAADGVRAAASTRSKSSMERPRSDSADMSEDDQVEQADTGPKVEMIWSHIDTISDALDYIDSLAGAPLPSVDRPWSALTREEQEELVSRMIHAGG
jgi:hypothetical protein